MRHSFPTRRSADRQRNLPFICHMEDNQREGSPGQGADKVAFYQHPARLRALRVQMEQASLAYFSTEALRDRMVELGVTMNSYVGPICAAVDLLPDPAPAAAQAPLVRSEEHTSELQSLMRISYAVFCLKKKTP